MRGGAWEGASLFLLKGRGGAKVWRVVSRRALGGNLLCPAACWGLLMLCPLNFLVWMWLESPLIQPPGRCSGLMALSSFRGILQMVWLTRFKQQYIPRVRDL